MSSLRLGTVFIIYFQTWHSASPILDASGMFAGSVGGLFPLEKIKLRIGREYSFGSQLPRIILNTAELGKPKGYLPRFGYFSRLDQRTMASIVFSV